MRRYVHRKACFVEPATVSKVLRPLKFIERVESMIGAGRCSAREWVHSNSGCRRGTGVEELTQRYALRPRAIELQNHAPAAPSYTIEAARRPCSNTDLRQ